jgi:hypothetical protein
MKDRIRSPKSGRMVTIGEQAYKDLITEKYISKNGKILKRNGRGKNNGCNEEGSGDARSIALNIYDSSKFKPTNRLYRIVWLPKIDNNLFLSNYEFAEDMAKKLGLRCIINVTKDPYRSKSSLLYVSVPIEDDFEMDYKTFAKNVNSCTKKLRECLKKGPTVVHCVEGMNRSVACIISFALKYGSHPEMSLSDWIKYIKCRKAQRGYAGKWCTLTNPAFRDHLKTLHGIK